MRKTALTVFIALLVAIAVVCCSGCCVPMLVRNKKTETTMQNSADTTSSESQKDNSVTESVDQPTVSQDTPSEEEPEETVFPVNMIGKTTKEVVATFGSSFVFSGFSGSTIMDYSELEMVFVLDQCVEEITGSEKIQAIIGYGKIPVYKNLTGELSYDELKECVEDNYLPAPESFYNEMDDYLEYQVIFNLDGYGFTYSWDDEPEYNKSLSVTVYSVDE